MPSQSLVFQEALQKPWPARGLLAFLIACCVASLPGFSPNAAVGGLLDFPYFLLFWWDFFWLWLIHQRIALHKRKHRRFWIGFAIGTFFVMGCFSVSFSGGMFWSFIIPPLFCLRFKPGSNTTVLEGRALAAYDQVRDYFESIRDRNDPGILWGGIKLPSPLATKNFLAAGAVGSGKSITLQLLMQDTVRHVRPGSGKRAFIFDANRDAFSQLVGMGVPHSSINILNPFDARCVSWHLALDINSEADAESLAEILIPKEEKEEPIWRDWSVELLKGVVECFNITAPHAWELRDIVLATETESALRMVLCSVPDTVHYTEVLRNEKLAQNIIATLRARMRKYRTIAALWHQANGRVSLDDWLHGNSILLLGKDNKAKEGLSALNRLLFKRTQQLLLDQPAQSLNTFVIFDEIASIGKLDGLRELCEEGRKRGVSVAIAFQSYAQLKEVYGNDVTESITGQFENKAILRLNDDVTSEWASKLIGEVYQRRITSSTSHNHRYETTHTQGETFERKRAVLASEFTSIAPVNFQTGQGLTGYYLGEQVYRTTYPIPLLKKLLLPKATDAQDFVPAPSASQRLFPWSGQDLQRLGLDPDAGSGAMPGQPPPFPNLPFSGLPVNWSENA